MSNTSPYEVLVNYVKRVRRGNTFTANDVRKRINNAGFESTQVGGAVRKAINKGLIVREWRSVKSTNPNHNGGNVSVYSRPSN